MNIELEQIQIDSGEVFVLETGAIDRTLPRLNRRLLILSPFDNSVIQRQRLKALFQYDYQIECYMPAAKRQYGYFCLPLVVVAYAGLVGIYQESSVQSSSTCSMKSLLVLSLTAAIGLVLCNKVMSRSFSIETESTAPAIESLRQKAPSTPSSATDSPQDQSWEEQGKATTGESIVLNLDSIQRSSSSAGVAKPPVYFFQYRLGTDRIYGMTSCNGEFSTSRTGHRYGYAIKPKSEANLRMLNRVCNYRPTTANVSNKES